MSEKYNVQLNLFKDRSEEIHVLNETDPVARKARSKKAQEIREQFQNERLERLARAPLTFSESEAGRMGFPINEDGTRDEQVITDGAAYVANLAPNQQKAVAERLKSDPNPINQALGRDILQTPIQEAREKERLTDMNTDTEYGRPRR